VYRLRNQCTDMPTCVFDGHDDNIPHIAISIITINTLSVYDFNNNATIYKAPLHVNVTTRAPVGK